VKFALLIHNASDLCREMKRGTFDEPAGETDSSRIDAFFRGYVGPPRDRRGHRRLACREGLNVGGQMEATTANAIAENFMNDMSISILQRTSVGC
jgi:hypothetical protein